MSLRDFLLAGKAVDFEAYDMHAHIGRYSHSIPDLDPASIVRVMDRLGVKSTVVSHLQCIGWDVTWGNDAVYEAMKTCPGRLLGYASIFPGNKTDVRKEAELRIKQGFTGFKFHCSNGFAYDDRCYEPAWEIANEHRLPILFHTWGSQQMFNEISVVAENAPNAFLLMGHSTSSNWNLYADFANKYKNVYLELCGSAAPLNGIEYLVEHAGADKVIWGSDCDFYSMEQQFGRALGCKCSDDDKIKIMSLNAKKILAARV